MQNELRCTNTEPKMNFDESESRHGHKLSRTAWRVGPAAKIDSTRQDLCCLSCHSKRSQGGPGCQVPGQDRLEKHARKQTDQRRLLQIVIATSRHQKRLSSETGNTSSSNSHQAISTSQIRFQPGTT